MLQLPRFAACCAASGNAQGPLNASQQFEAAPERHPCLVWAQPPTAASFLPMHACMPSAARLSTFESEPRRAEYAPGGGGSYPPSPLSAGGYSGYSGGAYGSPSSSSLPQHPGYGFGVAGPAPAPTGEPAGRCWSSLRCLLCRLCLLCLPAWPPPPHRPACRLARDPRCRWAVGVAPRCPQPQWFVWGLGVAGGDAAGAAGPLWRRQRAGLQRLGHTGADGTLPRHAPRTLRHASRCAMPASLVLLPCQTTASEEGGGGWPAAASWATSFLEAQMRGAGATQALLPPSERRKGHATIGGWGSGGGMGVVGV